MKKNIFAADTYIQGILAGDRILLSQAITLLESTRSEHQLLAQNILEGCMPNTQNSLRIGITGVPGVGKSTFIEAFGQKIIDEGHKIAVLAIDPSSRLNKGSILGDKTRMQQLGVQPNAYIRPSAAGTSLGGVARRTAETMLLCEAAGFDVLLVETVGVGQSETTVHDLTDFFLLLLLPNAGDELQGMKRGIVEMCDWIAINKADLNPTAAKITRAQYHNALHLFPANENGWTADASLLSATTHEGIDEIWQNIKTFEQATKANNSFFEKREQQNIFWFNNAVQEYIIDNFYKNNIVATLLPYLQKEVESHKISTTKALQQLAAALNT